MQIPFSFLKDRVGRGVMRDDLAEASSLYGDFVNEALHELQVARSWTCQRKQVDLTIPSMGSSIALPSDFKELQPQRSPVGIVLQDPNFPGAVVPVQIDYEFEELRKLWNFGGVIAAWYGMMRVYLKRSGVGVAFGIVVPSSQNIILRTNYVAWLPDLVADTDTNPISDDFPELVIAKAKAIALATINDPAAAQLEALAAVKFRAASWQDARSDVVGRDLRM